MYKMKIVFLYTDSTWSHQWVDCDLPNPNEIQNIIADYREKEEKALKEDNIDKEVKYVTVCEVNDVSDGKYHCGSCECCFDEPDDGDCPYCGGGDISFNHIDEPASQEFKGPRLHK